MPLELTRWAIDQAAAAFSDPVWLTCGIFREVDAGSTPWLPVVHLFRLICVTLEILKRRVGEIRFVVIERGKT